MALIKSVKSDFGIDGDYWRIIGVETWYGGPNQMWPDPNAKPVTFVHLAQYVNQKARDANGLSLQVKKVILDGEADAPGITSARPAYLSDPTREAAYTALKELPDWADAIDG